MGAPKYQYCVQEGEKIVRPEFASKDPSCPALDKGHLSKTVRDLLPEKIRHCRPKHFFDTQISPNFVKSCIVNTTNAQAAEEGACFGGNGLQSWKILFAFGRLAVLTISLQLCKQNKRSI